MMQPQSDQYEALARLINIAKSDADQSRLVANFLLAWWNADECGGFDLTDLWNVEAAIARDILLVALLIAQRHDYPTAYGYGKDFEQLVAEQRPQLLKTAVQ